MVEGARLESVYTGNRIVSSNLIPSAIPSRFIMTKQIANGAVHKVPADLRKVLTSGPEISAVWNDLTPLARNEWLCWIESAKKPETRNKRIERTRDDLLNGKRRPCCWPGCPHRQLL